MLQLSLFGYSSENTTQYNRMEKTYSDVLIKYLPADCVNDVCSMLANHKVFVKITRQRHTKLGDYHPPHNGRGHRITINHNLNKYAFLITLVHELAHLTVHEKHPRKTKPHGSEWKATFGNIMLPFLSKNSIPVEIVFALNKYLQNPAAASCTDVNLQKALKAFDEKRDCEKTFLLEEIPENTVFSLNGSAKFLKKGKRMRKRFLCNELNSKRKYLVSPVAEVIVVEK